MSSFSYLRDMFAAQFERDGDGFVFRQDQKGPALPVSRIEYEAFLAGYKRDLIIFMVATAGATLLLIGGGAYYIIKQDREPPEALLYIGLIILVAVTTLMSLWAWRAPARALRHRTPVGQAVSDADFKRKYLGRISYGQLALGALFGVAMPFLVSGEFDVFSGWHRLWFVFGAVVVATCAVQAFRKWRFEQQDRPNR